jgi:hypothetical protein
MHWASCVGKKNDILLERVHAKRANSKKNDFMRDRTADLIRIT